MSPHCLSPEEMPPFILVSHAISFRDRWLLACDWATITETQKEKEEIIYEHTWFKMSQNSRKRKKEARGKKGTVYLEIRGIFFSLSLIIHFYVF